MSLHPIRFLADNAVKMLFSSGKHTATIDLLRTVSAECAYQRGAYLNTHKTAKK